MVESKFRNRRLYLVVGRSRHGYLDNSFGMIDEEDLSFQRGLGPILARTSLSLLFKPWRCNRVPPTNLMVNASAIVHLATFSGNLVHPFPISPGFDIQKVSTLAESLPSHSWEFGAAAQAFLELYNASLSVFGPTPFPVRNVSPQHVPALAYAAGKIELGGGGANVLANGDGAVGDPASLGVSAVMLGKTDGRYAQAASDTINYLMNSAPRFWNGAISQRVVAPELWCVLVVM